MGFVDTRPDEERMCGYGLDCGPAGNDERNLQNTRSVLARLSNIKQLRILHRDVDVSDPQKGLRWCGLWIHHHDGTTETLGLWDDFLTKNARIIYDAETDGPLKRIAFQLRRRMPGDGKPGQSEYVVKISAKVAPLDDTESNEDTSDPQNQVRSEPDVDGDRIIEFRTCVSQPPVVWYFTELADHLEEGTQETVSHTLRRHSGVQVLQVE
ncbi:hypothetical protein HDV57DRAFT_433474 [Trichoderma longibrachiatum]